MIQPSCIDISTSTTIEDDSVFDTPSAQVTNLSVFNTPSAQSMNLSVFNTLSAPSMTIPHSDTSEPEASHKASSDSLTNKYSKLLYFGTRGAFLHPAKESIFR